MRTEIISINGILHAYNYYDWKELKLHTGFVRNIYVKTIYSMCPEILSIRGQWFFCVPYIRCFESLLRMKIEFRSSESYTSPSPCLDNFFDNIYKIMLGMIRGNNDKKYRRFGYYVGYLITNPDKH